MVEIEKGSELLETASVQNMPGHPERIRIGKGTFIAGKLQIFNYGGEIKIGNNTYIGEDSRIWSGRSHFSVWLRLLLQLRNNCSTTGKGIHQPFLDLITGM